MKLKRKTFQYLESEVYSYWDTLKQIKLLEYEMLNQDSTFSDDPQAGRTSVMTISDTTAKKATALIDNKQLKRMRQITTAIEKVFNGLIDDKKKLVKLYYWERPGELTWDGVARELNISRATCIRWRKSFIYEVAKELGER